PIPAPPDDPSGRAEPAFTHYLFGPALIDLRHTVRVALPAPIGVAREYEARIRTAFQYREPEWLLMPIGIALRICMAFGVIMGFVAVGLLWLLQLTVVTALVLVLLASALVLRVTDTGMRRVKGIRTGCPSCHQRVHYPSYECSGQGCGRRHRDVRPGRYGVLKRRCACGTLLPTLLLTGTGDGRMQAYCPHCKEPMSKGSGAVAEIVIPVLGATATGKTRLMTALVMGLLEGTGGHGAEAEFADTQSESAYRDLANKLRAGVHTWKTVKAKDAPLRAYSLQIRPPSGATRLFHVFDAPGELVAKSESMRELRYIKSARTFLFTLDLLSVDAVWESLEAGARAKNRGLRSDDQPGVVFDRVVQNIEGHGVQMGRARLAVALTKDDLVRECAALAGVGERSEDIGRWLEDDAGLDGMVRAMRRSFAEVRFFRTSSWLDGDEIDDGVLDLTGWLLVSEGLRVHH
ncbi:TRAFAC clade GTPase domain-containing protein, partial [Actinomadura soli]|uniref:TRAFAC clade GTPase domain-containing protein n=1 Tax=Actinomadura soli TaxID=2508997 RepID=UPI001485ED1A